MNKSSICLLLTGTIEPRNVPSLIRISPLEREQDYYDAIKYWLKTGLPVVFVENSNYHSERIESLFTDRNRNEYIKFVSTTSHLGKSNGEAEIIKYALKYSIVINNYSTIIKITGRFLIPNLAEVARSFNQINDLMIVGWLKFGLTFADSRLIIGKREFYEKYLMGEIHVINEAEGVYFEHVLARAIHRCMADGLKWRMPDVVPIFEGVAGTSNIRYNNNILRQIKRRGILTLTKRLLDLEY